MDDLSTQSASLRNSVLHMQQHAIKSMSAEITRLREREVLWQRCAEKTMQMYGGCIRPEYEKVLEDTAISLAGFVRFTDDERDAIEVAAQWCETPINPVYSQSSVAAMEAADTLRCLLARCAAANAASPPAQGKPSKKADRRK
jgi:hypothetical protein